MLAGMAQPGRQWPGQLAMSDLLPEITATAQAYYAQTSDFPLTATDFYDWLASLSPTRRADVLARGFTTTQSEPDFLRWCLELRGYSMRAFMAERLSVAAYEAWVLGERVTSPPSPLSLGRGETSF
jgi:hypothetical protein